MPMLAIVGLVGKIKNNFTKAIELLKLKFAKKHLAIFSAVLILVGIGLIIPVGQAHAYWGESILEFIVNHAIYPIIYIFFFFLFYIGYVLSWLGAIILDTNLNPAIINGVLTHPAIDQGWQIFRDIANLFFILILLFIAIGTIVRSQSYNLKNLLPKLIIAVFLINFSSVIAKVIIDFGNIFMYGVLKWMCPPGSTDCFTNFYAQLMAVIDKFKDTYDITYATTAQEVVGIAVAFIYSFIYGLILLALGTFLMIRIAAFALLIVLSPLAFVGEVFPGLKEISSEWWDKLIKYVMFGPIFALLLYISGLMASITISVPTSTIFSNNPNLGIFGELYATIIVNIIPLIFLIAIIPVTQKLGIAGANAVLGATTAIGFGAGALMSRTLAKGQFIPGSSYIGKGARYVDKKLFGGRVGGSYGRVKDWANQTRLGKGVGWVEKKAFGERKTLGQYKGMVARTLSPELWKKSIAHYMQEADDEAYKIPLMAKPDERRKFEMVYAHKKYQEGSQAGLYDNPISASDSAAKKYLEGDNLVMEEIVERDIATKSELYTFMKALNRARGLGKDDKDYYHDNESGVSKFLLDYSKKVGPENASIFGQRVGYLERKDNKHDTEKIAYYDENAKEHKIRDLSYTENERGERKYNNPEDYKQYTDETQKQMAKEKENRLKAMDTNNFIENEININGVYNPKAAGMKFIIEDVTQIEIKKKIQGMPSAKMEKYWDTLNSALGLGEGKDSIQKTEAGKKLDEILTMLEKNNTEAIVKAKAEGKKAPKVFNKEAGIKKLADFGKQIDKILKGATTGLIPDEPEEPAT